MKPAGQTSLSWNVLLITSDEHNPKIMGCAGNPCIKTPAFDRLAGEGTIFQKAYCPYPACAPSRQSMITGLYPQEHGQTGNPVLFSEKNQTWAHYFHEAGYITACIGKMHTNNEWNNHGYDYRFGPLDYDAYIQMKTPAWRAAARHTDNYEREVFSVVAPQLCREELQAEVLDTPMERRDVVWLDEAKRYLIENKDKPFFLHVSFTDPHWPWIAPLEYYNMYDPKEIDYPPPLPGSLDDDYLAYNKWKNKHWDKIPENIQRLCRAKYYGSVSYTDAYVGQLLELTDRLGLSKNTLVIYTSDHGDMAGEKGLWFKDLMFDSSARVPMIARMPGMIPAGRKCDALVSLVDLFPTIRSLAGVRAPMPQVSGVDMSEVFLGGHSAQEYVYCVYDINEKTLHPETMMVRSNRWKCIRYERAPEKLRYVLYDMENDPDETVNYAADPACAEILKEHLNAMDQFIAARKHTDIPPKVVLQIG